jgi:phosphoribosylaminoimidazole carboxylase
MLATSASRLNIKVVILDVGVNGPAKQVVSPSGPHLLHIDGSFTDSQKIHELASKVHVLTPEIEHVDVSALEDVHRTHNMAVHPSPSTLWVIQDKFRQKEHLLSHGSPVSEFMRVDSAVDSILDASQKLGWPLMLKSRTLAYDGRGNFVVRDLSQVEAAITALGGRPLYAEKWVPFVKEIAVLVVRTTSGDVRSYPVVETIQKESICQLVFAPLRTRDSTVSTRAQAIAEAAVKSFEGAGVFAVEMFLLENGMLSASDVCRTEFCSMLKDPCTLMR